MSKELIPKDNIPKSASDLIECVSEPVRRAFLINYPKTRQITKTSEAMGIDRTTVHYWLNTDELFSTAFNALKKELDTQLQEHYESLVKEIADDSAKTPPQSRLLASFFSLKALDNKYKDRQDPGQQVATQIIIHTSIPEPKYEVIEGDYEEIAT